MLGEILLSILFTQYYIFILFGLFIYVLYRGFRTWRVDMKFFYATILASTAVLLMAIYPIKPVLSDNMWSIPVAISIINYGDTNVDEFCLITGYQEHCNVLSRTVLVADGHFYNAFPLGISLLAVPVVFLGKIVGITNVVWLEWFTIWSLLFAQIFLGFLLIYACTKSNRIATIVTFLFLFATTNLYAMRHILWTHGGVELMIIVALFLLKKAADRKDWRWASWSALPLAFAYIIRPTSIIFLLVFGCYILLAFRKAIFHYGAIAFLILGSFFLWSYQIYHTILPPYYQPSRLAIEHFKEALIGQLFSPNRGLLIFTPLCFFSFYGLYLAWRQKNKLFITVGFCVFLYIAALAFFPHWWGGHSYGPRLFTDIVPFLVLLLIPVLERIFQKRTQWLSIAFIVIAMFSIFTAVQPFISRSVWNWNVQPNNIDAHSERLWDWRDMQMFREIRDGGL